MTERIIKIKNIIAVLSEQNRQGIAISRNDIKALQHEIADCQPPKRPADDIEKSIQILRKYFANQNVGYFYKNFIKKEYSAYLGLFTGLVNSDNIWLAHPERIAYNEAEKLIEPLACYAWFDDCLLAFLKHFHDTRQREVWIPAANALAILACRNETAKSYLLKAWERNFPNGLDAASIQSFQSKSHDKRHFLYAIACLIAHSGNQNIVGGFDISLFNKHGFKQTDVDGSWSSILIGCLEVLWNIKDYRAEIELTVRDHTKSLVTNYFNETALRRLYLKVENCPFSGKELGEIIRARLLNTGFLQAGKHKSYANTAFLVEAIWCWLENLQFFHQKEQLYKTCLQTTNDCLHEYLVPLVLNPDAFSFKQLRTRFIDNIRLIAEPDEWYTIEKTRQAQCVVELMLLTRVKELNQLNMKHFLGVASTDWQPDHSRFDVEVNTGIKIFLADKLAQLHTIPRILFYKVTYDRQTVCKLANIDNNYISIQAAIQIEKAIREIYTSNEHDVSEKIIKFLWQLLKEDPQQAVYAELLKFLDEEDCLYTIIRCFKELDRIRDNARDNGFDLASYVENYQVLMAHLIKFIESDARCQDNETGEKDINLPKLFTSISSVVNELKEHNDNDPPDLLIRAIDQLIGDAKSADFASWFRSFDLETNDTRNQWQLVGKQWLLCKKKFLRIKNEIYIDSDTYDEFANSFLDLKRLLRGITWLEYHIVDMFFNNITKWADRLRTNHKRSIKLNDQIQSLVNVKNYSGVKQKIAELKKSPPDDKDKETPAHSEINLLTTDTIQKLHTYLLNNFLFRDAEVFRKNKIVKDKITLPSFWKYLAPLLFGLIAGPFFILDFGQDWHALLQPGKELAIVLVCIVLLMVSLLLLGQKFFSKMNRRRFAMVFGLLFLASFSIVSIFLISLSGTEVRMYNGDEIPFLRQAMLWAPLSLFLGLFFGLILQGRDEINR